jgi:hypothetical protein
MGLWAGLGQIKMPIWYRLLRSLQRSLECWNQVPYQGQSQLFIGLYGDARASNRTCDSPRSSGKVQQTSSSPRNVLSYDMQVSRNPATESKSRHCSTDPRISIVNCYHQLQDLFARSCLNAGNSALTTGRTSGLSTFSSSLKP